MSELKDPAIKLFGKTIALPEISTAADSGGAHSAPSSGSPGDDGSTQDHHSSSNCSLGDNSLTRAGEEQVSDKDLQERKLADNKEEDGAQSLTLEELTNQNATSETNKNSDTRAADNDDAMVKDIKSEEEQSGTSNSQEKTLKKPDKILPCPRCNSMDTKFCYFNNYNVNQPRHFCKNCQRYWTAGGTMRNVPVGAGRRKNKNLASQYHHITVSECLQNPRSDLPNEIHHPTLKPNNAVLAFSSDTLVSESMVSVLSISEKTVRNCSQNVFHKPEELKTPVSYAVGENGDDHSSGSSVTAANSKDEIRKTVLPDPMTPNYHSFPGAPWPYPWNSAQSSSVVSSPAFCPPGFPIPFYPAAPYWGCTLPGSWNVSWVTQPTTSYNPTVPTSGPNSPTLGKHSREDNTVSTITGEEDPQKKSNPEKCLWVPKILRIDEPGEAARSSIWETLGIKHDQADSISGEALFKSFQSNCDKMNHTKTSTVLLQANPAALSRSQNFHESS